MPSKRKAASRAAQAPDLNVSKELLDRLVTGPMRQGDLELRTSASRRPPPPPDSTYFAERRRPAAPLPGAVSLPAPAARSRRLKVGHSE